MNPKGPRKNKRTEMNPLKVLFAKTLIALALLTAVVLAATGHLDMLVQKCGGAILSDSNSRYLEDSFDRSLRGFLVLSAIKSGVAVIEGSEIGIGFNLEVGDIAQSIYDYVDVAWKAALAGGTILLLMKLILQTIQLVDNWVLFSMLAVALFLFLSNWIFSGRKRLIRILKECLLFVSVLTIAFYIILPFSIAGAAFLSKQITQPLVKEAQQGFEKLQGDLTPEALYERLFPDSRNNSSLWSLMDLKAKLETSKAAIIQMVDYLKKITRDSAIWAIKIIAGYLFDCLIFPLAFFVVVYILTKNLLAYVMGVKRDYTVQEELKAIFAK